MIEKSIEQISNFFNALALVALTAMLAVVSLDIAGSKLFSTPLPGAMDIVSLLGVLVIGFSVPQSYRMGRHIKVDFITMLMPASVRKYLQCLTHVLCFVFFGFIVWRMFIYAHYVWEYGEKSMTIKIPLYPFVYALTVAVIPMLILLPLQLIRTLKH